MSASMTDKMSKLVEEAYTKMLNEAIQRLSEKYNFDLEEGQRVVGIQTIGDVRTKKEKPKLVLPWTGEGCDQWCQGIRPSHGLYAQCTNKPGQDGYCSTCAKKANKPTVENRDEWLSTNGKKAKRFGWYLETNGLSREDAEQEASKFGLTIPEIEYEKEVTSRGRPRKTAATSDTESEDDEPKKQGRPRKNAESPDLFAQLVAEHNVIEGNAEGEKAAAQEQEKAEKAAAKIASKEKEKAAKEKEKAEKAAAKEKEREEKAAAKIAAKEKEKLEKEKLKYDAERENERAVRREKTNANTVDVKEYVPKMKTPEGIFGDSSDSDTVVEEEYVDETDVSAWEHKGVKYLLDKKTGDVYDKRTQEHIGIWNGEDLEELESESEEE